MSRLRVEQMRIERNVAVVQAPPDLDVVIEVELRNELIAAGNASPNGNVILDVTKVQFLDSIGIGLMTGAYRRALARSATFVIVGASDIVRARLRICGLLKHFTLVDTLDEAFSRYGRP